MAPPNPASKKDRIWALFAASPHKLPHSEKINAPMVIIPSIPMLTTPAFSQIKPAKTAKNKIVNSFKVLANKSSKYYLSHNRESRDTR
jgi:hypothetical protein